MKQVQVVCQFLLGLLLVQKQFFPLPSYVLAAYVLVSFTLFVMARFSPYEWNSPHPCESESELMENQFSVSNSFWFITGTFLRQVKEG